MKNASVALLLTASLLLASCGTKVIEPPQKNSVTTQPGGGPQLQGQIAAYTARVQEGLDEREKGVAISNLPKAAELTAGTTLPATRPSTQPAPQKATVAATEPAEKTPAQTVANTPAEVPATAPAVAATRPATIQDLLPLLRDRAAAQPQNLSLAMSLKLLEESIAPIPAPTAAPAQTPAAIPAYVVPHAQDERILNDLASVLRTIPAQSTQNIATRSAPLIELSKTYAAEGDLKIPVMALTTRVDSFGVYQPMEQRLPAGRRTPAVLYCEVSNFVSAKTDDGYVTKLAHQDTLLTSDGMLVWRSNPDQINDVCRNARNDFYMVKRINFPEALPVGNYVLKITVTDLASNKIATASMNVSIGQ